VQRSKPIKILHENLTYSFINRGDCGIQYRIAKHFFLFRLRRPKRELGGFDKRSLKSLISSKVFLLEILEPILKLDQPTKGLLHKIVAPFLGRITNDKLKKLREDTSDDRKRSYRRFKTSIENILRLRFKRIINHSFAAATPVLNVRSMALLYFFCLDGSLKFGMVSNSTL